MRRSLLAGAALVCAGALSLTMGMACGARAQISFDVNVNVGFAPPELPTYDQPAIPEEGYIWTPGYWSWDADDEDYFWVPGTWVMPPEQGLLWTPGYWGYDNGQYQFNSGYWGESIGFYGGVDYGFGYSGDGYQGGYWRSGNFFYNTSVNNVSSVHVTNVYNKVIVHTAVVGKASYSGGPGGIVAHATPEQLSAAKERHVPPTANQRSHVQLAAKEPDLRASVNHGKPAIAATPRATAFTGPGVVRTSKVSAPYSPPAKTPRPATAERGAAAPARPEPAMDQRPPPSRDQAPRPAAEENRSEPPAAERAPPRQAPPVAPPRARAAPSPPPPRQAPAPRPPQPEARPKPAPEGRPEPPPKHEDGPPH